MVKLDLQLPRLNANIATPATSYTLCFSIFMNGGFNQFDLQVLKLITYSEFFHVSFYILMLYAFLMHSTFNPFVVVVH